MRSKRNAPLPDDVCLCIPSLGRVCVWCASKGVPPPETVEEADGFEPGPEESAILRGESCPWNPDTLPERLQGYGHRGADQDGYDGEEWVSPQRHFEETLIEAARVTFEVSPAESP